MSAVPIPVFLLCGCIIHLFFSICHTSPTPPKILPITTTTAFENLISKRTLTFIEFFHPRCPHCQAIAPHIEALANLIATHNANPKTPPENLVTIAEVDASIKQNEDLMRTHAESFPTLKLFASARLVSEYQGPRTTQLMFDYIQNTLHFRAAQLVEQIHTRQQLHLFLQTNSDRPVIISIFHSTYNPASVYPSHIRPCPEQWLSLAERMRNTTAPNVSFAAVLDPSLLLPPEPDDFDRWQKTARVSTMPAMVAASKAHDFWKHAQWWYPAVRQSDSMHTFMHIATMPHPHYTILDPLMAPILLTTVQPLLLLFGLADHPSLQDQHLMHTASTKNLHSRVVVVFLNRQKFPEFAHHVGIIPDQTNPQNTTEPSTSYVLYRAAANTPLIHIFQEHSNQTVYEWLDERAKHLNHTDMPTPPGAVLDLHPNMSHYIFHLDGRGVLLELYRPDCAACQRFRPVYERAARLLAPHAGALVVARLDVTKYTIPKTLRLPPVTSVPAFFYVTPGMEADLYEGGKTATGLATFARIQSESENIPFARLTMAERAPEILFYIGLVLIAAGLLCRRATKSKRMHIT